MRAVVLGAPGPIEDNPLQLQELPTPEPGPDEIVLDVRACGVCRSNLHMIEGDWLDGGVPGFTPIVPGHEVVGVVSSVGSQVTSMAVGDRVGVQPLWGTCGHCDFCVSGREQLCQSKLITGETVHGGYAEKMLAKAEHAYPVPDSLSDAEAAPLFCPGITAYGAIDKACLDPSKSVAVFGVGGVGHLALQFGSLTGARTYAVTRGSQRQSLAQELGARVVDASSGDPVAQLQRDGGVDAAVVFAPSDEVVRQAIAATKPGGVVVIGVNCSVGAFPFVDEKRIVGSLLGSRHMMRDMLRIAGEGRVRVTTETFPLDQAADALTKLKRGEVRGRLVLTTQ
jgi:propanol-preferring alcohol dehydrogenase